VESHSAFLYVAESALRKSVYFFLFLKNLAVLEIGLFGVSFFDRFIFNHEIHHALLVER